MGFVISSTTNPRATTYGSTYFETGPKGVVWTSRDLDHRTRTAPEPAVGDAPANKKALEHAFRLGVGATKLTEGTPTPPRSGSQQDSPGFVASTSPTFQPSPGKAITPDSFAGPLFLVNYMPFPGSGWRYMRMISSSVPVPTKTVTVMMGNHPNYMVMGEAGQVGVGLSFRPRVVSSALNYVAARFVYRSLGRELIHMSDGGGVVHFLQEEINPWVFPSHSVVTIHTNPQALLDTDQYYSVSAQYKLAYKHNLKKYGRFAVSIVESEYIKRGLEEYGFPGSPIVTAPAVEPIFHPRGDRTELRKKFGLPPDAKVLLSISTDERRKNLSILPRVMDLLPHEFLLVRVGSPVRGARVFTALTDEQVAELYALSDALLFPTLEEGFGYPVIEAFASETPVVTSNIPVMQDVAGGAAILVDPKDAPGLARACHESVSRRSELVGLGKKRVEFFSVPAFVARMERVYSLALRG